METVKELCVASKVAWDAGDTNLAMHYFHEAQAAAGEVKLHQLGDGQIGILIKSDSKEPKYEILSE